MGRLRKIGAPESSRLRWPKPDTRRQIKSRLLQLIFGLNLVAHVSFHHRPVTSLSHCGYAVAICPELPAPQRLLHTRLAPKYLPRHGALALECSHNRAGAVLAFISVAVQVHGMARPLRLEYAGALYHLTSRGNARADIFAGDEERRLVLELLGFGNLLNAARYSALQRAWAHRQSVVHLIAHHAPPHCRRKASNDGY
jgi:hypothetical protein